MSTRNPLTFRRFTERDGPLLARWLSEAGLGESRGMDPVGWPRRILENDRIVCFVAEFRGSVCGFFRLDIAPDRTAELTLLVAPGLRRRGFGRTLLESALVEARRRRLKRLIAVVDQQNPSALGFFLSGGFEFSGAVVRGFDHLERWVHGGDRERPLEIIP